MWFAVVNGATGPCIGPERRHPHRVSFRVVRCARSERTPSVSERIRPRATTARGHRSAASPTRDRAASADQAATTMRPPRASSRRTCSARAATVRRPPDAAAIRTARSDHRDPAARNARPPAWVAVAHHRDQESASRSRPRCSRHRSRHDTASRYSAAISSPRGRSAPGAIDSAAMRSARCLASRAAVPVTPS